MATTEAVFEATDLEIDRYLQPIEVVNYFVGQVSSSNHDLIKHFRPLLVKSSLGPDNHAILKKITAQLVIVKRIQGSKSLELKPQFQGLSPHEISMQLEDVVTSINTQYCESEASSLEIKRDEETTATATKIDSNPRSRASVYEAISLQNEADYFLSSAGSKKDSATTSDTNTTVDVEIEHFDHPKIVQHFDEKKVEEETEVVREQLPEEPDPVEPLPVPVFIEKAEHKFDRKAASKRKSSKRKPSKTLTTISEDANTQNLDEDENVFKEKENEPEKAKTMRRVQESVRNLEQVLTSQQIEAESEKSRIETREKVILRTRANRALTGEKAKRRVSSIDIEMDPGYAPLNDKTRAWILAAAKNDEDSLRRLLNENPEIYSTRDPSTGYTALHWAAKFGAEMLVHLLIGRYRMNPNVKTRGGYTPLMLSAMHRRQSVFNLLLNTYGANPNIRDYSGHKAQYYLPPSAAAVVSPADVQTDYDEEHAYPVEDQVDNQNRLHLRFHRRPVAGNGSDSFGSGSAHSGGHGLGAVGPDVGGGQQQHGHHGSGHFLRDLIRDSTRRPKLNL